MNKRVLIAEDDHFYRKFLIEAFDKYNYKIVTAIDGNDASKYILEGIFDLIVLDFHLPGKMGDEIMREIDDKGIDTPVIVITADDSIETEREIRSFGPAYLFIKPFIIKDMRKVVKKIFAQKAKQYT